MVIFSTPLGLTENGVVGFDPLSNEVFDAAAGRSLLPTTLATQYFALKSWLFSSRNRSHNLMAAKGTLFASTAPRA